MIARIVYYIRSKSLGRFIGECLGMGFFETHMGNDCSPEEEPVQFETEEIAQAYLNSWTGGQADCFVEEGIG